MNTDCVRSVQCKASVCSWVSEGTRNVKMPQGLRFSKETGLEVNFGAQVISRWGLQLWELMRWSWVSVRQENTCGEDQPWVVEWEIAEDRPEKQASAKAGTASQTSSRFECPQGANSSQMVQKELKFGGISSPGTDSHSVMIYLVGGDWCYACISQAFMPPTRVFSCHIFQDLMVLGTAPPKYCFFQPAKAIFAFF